MQISVPLVFHCAGPQKTPLRRSKFAFRLRETVARIFFLRLAVAPWRFSFIRSRLLVNPDDMDTRRVSGSRQFKICVSPARNTRSDCFPCAGPHKTRLRRSKFAFRLRRATQSDDKDAIRHESETWILQKLLRYKDAETWIRRHGSCRGS